MKITTEIIKKELERMDIPGCKRVSKKTIDGCITRLFESPTAKVLVYSGDKDDYMVFSVYPKELNINPIAFYTITEDEDEDEGLLISIVPCDFWNTNKCMLDHYPNEYKHISNTLDKHFDSVGEWVWSNNEKSFNKIVTILQELYILPNKEFEDFVNRYAYD